MNVLEKCHMRLMDLHKRLCQQHAIIMGNKLAFGIGLASKDKQLKIAVEALEDFKTNGTRFDMNPTVDFGCTVEQSIGWFVNYLERIEESVMERAKEALEKIKDETKC